MAQVGSGLLGELTMMAADVYRKTVRRGQDGEFINFASPLLLLASRSENDLRFTSVYLQRFEDCNRRGLDYMPPSETQSAEICRQVLEEEKAEASATRSDAKCARSARRATESASASTRRSAHSGSSSARRPSARRLKRSRRARRASAPKRRCRSAMHVVHTDPCMIADCAQAARRLTEALKRHRAAASESLVAKMRFARRAQERRRGGQARRKGVCAFGQRPTGGGRRAGQSAHRGGHGGRRGDAQAVQEPAPRGARSAHAEQSALRGGARDARKRSDNTGVERSAQRERGVDRGVRVGCVVCLDAAPTFAVVPCGHRCLCSRCVVQVLATTRVCPLCRASMDGCGALQIFE